MLDTEFWGEIISIYTDADAMEDGTFTDISGLNVFFNALPINRATCGVTVTLDFKNKTATRRGEDLQFIAAHCTLDGDGADAWGIFEKQARYADEKFWLIPNETGGCTIMLPDEY